MESIKLLQKGLEKFTIEIISLLAKLNTKCFEIQYELIYKYEPDAIKILSIELCPEIDFFDIQNLEYSLILNLSNGERKRLNEIELSNLSLLYCIVHTLQAAAFPKNYENVFKKKLHVEGKDIIITDPCYIIKKSNFDIKRKYVNMEDYDLLAKNNYKINELNAKQILKAYYKYKQGYKLQEKFDKEYYSQINDDWKKCKCGEDMKSLGINNYLITSTLYGDWSCTTYNSDTDKPIGHFCADAGLVGVFILDEILEYNPKFDYHLNKEWTTTLIKNFTGDIWFEKHHHEGIYEDTTDWHDKGDIWEEDSIHVVGKGNINFITKQTGF